MPVDVLFIIGGALLLLTYGWSFWYERFVTKMAPPAGDFAKTSFGRVHYLRSDLSEVEKSKLRPLVLLHGSTTNALDMDIDLARRFDGERDVIIPDRLGHGFSDRPKDGWRLDTQAAAVNELLQQLGVEQPIICGQSYGGALALRYALDYPDNLSGLVLLAPVTHPWPGGVTWYNRIGINPLYGSLFRRTFIALYGRYGSSRAVTRALHGSPHLSAYHARTRAALTFRPTEFHANAEDIVRLYEQLDSMHRHYGSITVPTEILAGSHDMTVITSVHGRRLVKDMPNANVSVIEEAGHAIHHTHPEASAETIRALDARLASEGNSGLQGALRRLTSVFPKSA
ncbi:MAG: alpha/beta hydrolase [Pseudomonadota bacterium]